MKAIELAQGQKSGAESQEPRAESRGSSVVCTKRWAHGAGSGELGAESLALTD